MAWVQHRAWLILLAAAVAALPAGCGFTQNPSYFPHLLPTGDIEKTHAKPPGHGYYANFDPYACRIEVRPVETSNPVGTQQVLIATIYDNHGQPRRGRRVEWMIDGPGHIVEVDESGFAPGRGWKDGSRSAVSYTDYFEHTITRGNDNPNDDFTVRPGQSWCVISSPVEGDTVVTILAPEIFNWDKRKSTVTIHWLNAGWILPAPSTARGGTAHPLTTNVYRLTDRLPAPNYRVRYTVLEGPPAGFGPQGQPVAEVVTDQRGNATVPLVQLEPRAGVNRIGIEIIRPAEPGSTGPGIIIGKGETYVEWTSPAIQISKVGPPAAGVGQQLNYTITVTNAGRVEVEAATVRDTIPDGMTFIGSQPQANAEGRDLIWTVGPLAPGRSAVIQAVFRADREGTYTNSAIVTTAGGVASEAKATVQVARPGLNLSIDAPNTANFNTPVEYRITVRNTGAAPATNVVLRAALDEGLEHESGQRELQLKVGTLPPGGTRTDTLVLVPKKEGRLSLRVDTSADGGLADAMRHTLEVIRQRMSLKVSGPAFKYATSEAEFNILVANPTDRVIDNVGVRAYLPGEVSFIQASQGGQLAPAPGTQGEQVVWNLGPLRPREERRIQLTVRADKPTPKAVHFVTASADGGFAERAEADLEIRGVPALKLEAEDTLDPVEIGDKTEYRIRVTNTGSLVARNNQLVVVVPPEMKIRRVLSPDQVEPKTDGNKLTFQPVDRLEPGKVLLYTIEVEAEKEGDARLSVQLRSDALGPDPVTEEESTIVTKPIADRDNGLLLPPPP